MKLLCRIGWHDWSPWKYRDQVNYYADRKSVNETPYKITKCYVRTCDACGKPQQKELAYVQ